MDANSGSCAIKLCGEGRRGLLKRTVQEFGADLGELTRRKGVLEARLMLRGRKRELHLRGTVNELEKVGEIKKDYFGEGSFILFFSCQIKARVAEMLVEVKEGSGVDEEDQEEECCVTCFTEPEEGDETRLELCGHLTCKSCLRLQVQTAELPMVCPKEVREATRGPCALLPDHQRNVVVVQAIPDGTFELASVTNLRNIL